MHQKLSLGCFIKKLRLVHLTFFLTLSDPGTEKTYSCSFSLLCYISRRGHHFRSTFIPSRYKYMVKNEERRGEEDEHVFSRFRIRHYWFAVFIILVRGFLPHTTCLLNNILRAHLDIFHTLLLLLRLCPNIDISLLLAEVPGVPSKFIKIDFKQKSSFLNKISANSVQPFCQL